MAKSRKTFEVKALKTRVNAFLKNSKDNQTEMRQGMSIMLEGILMDTDNYNGFGYLDSDNMADSLNGTTVGINTNMRNPHSSMTYDEKFAGCDESRRYYY